MSRRPFLIGGLLGGVAGLGLSGAAAAYEARYVNPYEPRLERVELTLPPGHEGLAGLRIGFLSDTHVGPFISPDDLARATALLLSQQPDVVLLGGDYIAESPRYAGPAAEVLGDLARAAPLGGFAVLGNHDFTAGSGAKVTEALERAGIPVLRNAAGTVRFNGDALWVAGVDEALIAGPNPAVTFAAIPQGAAVVALWHEPDWAERTARLGAFAQLSGHSHGGQVRLPGLGPVGLPPGGRRYVTGLNQAAGMPVYVTRGVGVYRPPIRLNCPPEVTLITLAPRRYPMHE